MRLAIPAPAVMAAQPALAVDAVASFRAAMAFTLRKDIEGGWYDGSSRVDPNPTNMGYTLAAWRRQRVVPGDLDGDGDVDAQDLKRATRPQIEACYEVEYFRAARCHEMPLPVAVVVCDTAINCGVGAAALIVQDALGIPEGQQAPRFGALTMGGIRERAPHALAHDILWERLEYYENVVRARPVKLPALPVWIDRCYKLRQYLRTLAGSPLAAAARTAATPL